MPNEQNYYFIFSATQPNTGHYVKIFGTYTSARDIMIRKYGYEWMYQTPCQEDIKDLKELEI